MKLFDIDLQEILIGLALVITIPIAVYFGCNAFVSHPKLIWKEEHKFMESINKKRPKDMYDAGKLTPKMKEWKEEHDQRKKEWKKTSTFLEWEYKHCTKMFFDLIVKGVTSCICFVLGAYVAMSAIAASMIATGLILCIMYVSSSFECAYFYGLSLFWIEFMFVLLSLCVVLYASYRDSEARS